jgi:RNA polymerase sigma factor (sigma-70 family)
MPTDEQLLKLLKGGDQEALGLLYEKYFDRVLQYAYRRSFDQQVAYDIAANVFTKVAESIRGFKPKHENAFVGWLFRIASNEVIAYYRKPEKYKSAVGFDDKLRDELSAEGPSDAEMLDTIELYKKLYKAMRELKIKEQQIVDLYYFENLSYKEISTSTGVKESNVGVILHRSLKKLQAELQPIVKGVSI